MAGEVRVPGVAVHELGAVEVGRHQDIRADRLEGGVRVRELCGRRKLRKGPDLEVDEPLELAREVGDMDPGTAVDVGRVLSGQQGDLHGRTCTGRIVYTDGCDARVGVKTGPHL